MHIDREYRSALLVSALLVSDPSWFREPHDAEETLTALKDFRDASEREQNADSRGRGGQQTGKCDDVGNSVEPNKHRLNNAFNHGPGPPHRRPPYTLQVGLYLYLRKAV